MKPKHLKALLLTLMSFVFSSQSTAQYDGRGRDNCEDLRLDVEIAQDSLNNWRDFIQAQKARSEQWNMGTSSLQTNQYKNFMDNATAFQESRERETLIERENELESAISRYRMNGCTSGGSTLYHHNYKH